MEENCVILKTRTHVLEEPAESIFKTLKMEATDSSETLTYPHNHAVS